MTLKLDLEYLTEPLRADLVAAAASREMDRERRSLMWWLHSVSQRPDGLARLACDLVEKCGDRLGTPRMHEVGLQSGEVYSDVDCSRIHYELNRLRERARRAAEADDGAITAPRTLSFPQALEACLDKAQELPNELRDMALGNDRVNYFRDVWGALGILLGSERERARCSVAETTVTRMIFEALDYAVETRSMVLINGEARIGKTTAARAWVEANPHRARYLEVRADANEIEFLRDLAVALGAGDMDTETRSVAPIKRRIEASIGSLDLALVLDEAHYVFNSTSRTCPKRLEYIRTALVNRGVPVILIATPQFIRRMNAVEQESGWNMDQFKGRIAKYYPLPSTLPERDFKAAARFLLPEGCKDSIAALVGYAEGSDFYFQAVVKAVNEARFLARKAGSETVRFSHVKDAIARFLYSDQAMAQAFDPQPKRKGKRPAVSKPTEPPAVSRDVNEPLNVPEQRLQSNFPGRDERPLDSYRGIAVEREKSPANLKD